MAVDDVRQRVRVKLEQLLGPFWSPSQAPALRRRTAKPPRAASEETSWLMDRPPGGWSDLVTNQTLDAKLSVLDAKMTSVEHRLLAEIERRFKAQTWALVSALIAGLSVFGVIVR